MGNGAGPIAAAPLTFPQRTNHGLEVARCIGGRHGTPRTSPFGAFYLLSALPRGLDLGTPPIEPLSGERR